MNYWPTEGAENGMKMGMRYATVCNNAPLQCDVCKVADTQNMIWIQVKRGEQNVWNCLKLPVQARFDRQGPGKFHQTLGTYPRPSTTSLWRKSFHINVFWGTCGVCQGSVGIFLDRELRAKRIKEVDPFLSPIHWCKIDCHVQPKHEITNQIHMAYLRAWAAEGAGISSYPILAPLLIQCIFVTCISGADLTKVLATDGRSLMVRAVFCGDIKY